jgi:oxygen-independent coproporphyrinogen-3 oxidase
METMAETLDQVIGLSPDRISCYNYAHMPHRFKSQRAIDRLSLPPAEMKLPLMEYIAKRFMDAGYVFIGMDHFVKPDDDLAIAQQTGKLQRNFQGYSTCMAPDLLGLGMSSISSLTSCFSQNSKNLEDYYRLIDEDRLPIERGLVLSAEDKLRREVIMQIICKLALEFTDIEDKFKINFCAHFEHALAKLKPMADDGLIKLDTHSIRVTERGRPMIRNICMAFDQYIEELQESGVAHHSKTL